MKIWAVPIFLGGVLVLGSQAVVCQDWHGKQSESIELTREHPSGYFALEAKTLAAAPPIVALSFPKVENPGKIGMEAAAYLAYYSRAGAEEGKILIGNVAFYPSDQPAGFLLRASQAFAELKEKHPNAANVRLLVQMKPIHRAQSWAGVRVTVAAPKWKDKPGE